MNQPTGTAAFDPWADFYDLVDGDRRPMLAFYESLVQTTTASILELGCGTGLVTQVLADCLQRNGRGQMRVVGVDEAAAMLAVARERDKRCEWVLGDMRNPLVRGPFDLVVCCYNGLQHMLTDNDLEQAFSYVRRVLNPLGRYAFDVYQPNEAYLNIRQIDRLVRRIVRPAGPPLELREDTHYDSTSRVYAVDWRLIEEGRGEPLAKFTQLHRQYPVAEIDRILALSGLRAVQRYGDFDRSIPGAGSKKQVVIAARVT